ncbi:hypothetical protein IC615_23195 [Serratia ureilytica]
MRTVERAETQVHDAAAQGPAIIIRLPDGARQRVLAIVFISSPKRVDSWRATCVKLADQFADAWTAGRQR